MIYFDHNATTPIDPRVVEVMMPYLSAFYGNPSSLYRMGRIARSAIDTAREQVAALVGALPAEIVFTSGGTEANNLVMQGNGCNAVVAISSVEHPSVMESASYSQRVLTLPVNKQGLLAFNDVVSLFEQSVPPGLVSVMLANNETGAIQNINEIALFLKGKATLLHTDAVQAIGKIPVDFAGLSVDLMTISSHKIYGPKGCGALVFNKHSCEIKPVLIGGGQEGSRRAGTENVAAIVGFGKAAELARLELDQRSSHCLKLRKQLEQGLKRLPGLVIFSEQVDRLPNTVQFAIEGVDGEMLLMQLDQNNIAVSSGSACASGGGKASSVLLAMGVEPQLAKGAVRISLGKDNTEVEITKFLEVLKSIVIKE